MITASETEARQAFTMLKHLPPTLIEMIDNGTWAGDGCMIMVNGISRPTAAEIAQNYCFLKPLVMLNRREVFWGPNLYLY